MASLRKLISYLGAGSLLSQVPFVQPPQEAAPSTIVPFSLASNCPADNPTSCHNSTIVGDSCCFIYPGGQLLQTQFWDTSPSIGPADSWTLHGLWPDLCDGTYDEFCTAAPQYHNITQILKAAGQNELLSYMSEYWLPNRGSAESFWQHEWNKHGTCINTLSQSCYGESYTPGIEVVDFFTRTVNLFKSLDTHAALAKEGIVPVTGKTYTNAQIQAALTKVTGMEVVLGCRRGELNQAWYYYNVKGSLQTGDFVPTGPVGTGKGSCPRTGIRYLPKRA